MANLTKREEQILDKLLVADVAVAARDLGITPATIYSVRARVRYKEERCRDFLKKTRKYKPVLHR